MSTTHTYAVLDISPSAFREISSKLDAAGYQHAFHEEDGRTVIDMHGIAVAPEPYRVPCEDCIYCPACKDRHRDDAARSGRPNPRAAR